MKKQFETIAKTPRLLIATDFDGVLAAIEPRPEMANPARGVIDLLRRAVALPRTSVAIVSGRSLADLKKRIGPLNGAWFVGGHGAEIVGPNLEQAPDDVSEILDALVEPLLRAAPPEAGFVHERKPTSIAVHYRQAAPNVAKGAVDKITQSIASAEGLKVQHGKKVVEIVAVDADKGQALRTLRQATDATGIVYLGDDVTDEDAFRVLQAGDIGIKVGEPPTHAGFCVESIQNAHQLLANLIDLRSAWNGVAKSNAVALDTLVAKTDSDGATPKAHGRVRVAIETVSPSVPGGDFHVKRTIGESVVVEADIFADGHDKIAAVVRHRHCNTEEWREVRMEPLVNDRWTATFQVRSEGEHEYTIEAWIDHFGTWQRDLLRRAEANQDLSAEFLIGAALIEQSVGNAEAERGELNRFSSLLRDTKTPERLAIALDDRLTQLVSQADARRHAARLDSPVRLWADRERARFSSWYELFPRSAGSDGLRHGTFRDVIARIDAIAAMGFDVLYMPPIHPIGRQFRKGKNNSLDASVQDVGSPWAIGGPEGGHDAIHPELGSLSDFGELVRAAHSRGIEIALDFALQCSPDHPYVKQHPHWFKHRPDGSIQYAENPPKKYQDIYPLDFECEDWKALWDEILGVVLVWVERGVRIFRVDNPHTKPFAMWEWLIAEVKRRDPGVLFLAEAFTRPRVMHRLAKLGFTQSYTYFAWRNGPVNLKEYFTELTTAPAVDYFRPNAWPCTPDILTEYLQHGGRGAFIVRAALAATLCASWGIYGPAFELMESRPAKPGSEEYLDSEKYQLRAWPIERTDSLAPLIAALNAARRENSSLQQDRTLRFHGCDNPAIVCYSKTDGDNAIVVVANTDPYNIQWSPVHLNLAALGLDEHIPYQMHDLLTGVRYRWQGSTNVVGLDPATCPVHVFKVRRHQRTEAQFEYFI